MTGILVSLLTLSPGIQLADNVESRHVALADRIQLVVDEGLRPSLDVMTREQLAAELRRIDETRPSIVAPIVSLAIGLAFAIPGTYLLASNFAAATGCCAFNQGEAILAGGFGTTLLITGVIFLAVGGGLLPFRLNKANTIDAERELIRMKINALDQGAPPPVPPPPGPDVAPPPPPQARNMIPGGMQTILTF